MKELDLNYIFDLERVIKNSNKDFITKKGEEKNIEANFIIEAFANKVGIDAKTIKNAKIKTTETIKMNAKSINEPKIKKKRVVKYFIMSEKNKLEIIKQITVSIKKRRTKEIFRDIKLFEKEDLIKLGYITENERINYINPAIKKLGLEYRTDKIL